MNTLYAQSFFFLSQLGELHLRKCCMKVTLDNHVYLKKIVLLCFEKFRFGLHFLILSGKENYTEWKKKENFP